MKRFAVPVLLVMVACSAARPPIAEHDTETQVSAPARYCAKIAALAAAAGHDDMKCSCMTELYDAMTKDNAAWYACSARCVDGSSDYEAEQDRRSAH